MIRRSSGAYTGSSNRGLNEGVVLLLAERHYEWNDRSIIIRRVTIGGGGGGGAGGRIYNLFNGSE